MGIHRLVYIRISTEDMRGSSGFKRSSNKGMELQLNYLGRMQLSKGSQSKGTSTDKYSHVKGNNRGKTANRNNNSKPNPSKHQPSKKPKQETQGIPTSDFECFEAIIASPLYQSLNCQYLKLKRENN